MRQLILAGIAGCGLLFFGSTEAQSLRGSAASVEKQNRIAVSYGYTFVETAQALTQLASSGQLIRVTPTRHLELHDVSFPYVRPGVQMFLDRLSSQYHNACGEKLVVTSLARPIDRQPANAATNSVHPTGMAVDLRVPSVRRCRSWLESTLLSLESTEVLDVTRERNPPHYHVAVYVASYESYVASMNGSAREYVVRRGDTLSGIALQHDVTVSQLRMANAISGDMINIGQKLTVPGQDQKPAAIPSSLQTASVSQVTHKVQRGETLWRIGNQYGTSVAQIRRENGLQGDLLQVGQVLRITQSR